MRVSVRFVGLSCCCSTDDDQVVLQTHGQNRGSALELEISRDRGGNIPGGSSRNEERTTERAKTDRGKREALNRKRKKKGGEKGRKRRQEKETIKVLCWEFQASFSFTQRLAMQPSTQETVQSRRREGEKELYMDRIY